MLLSAELRWFWSAVPEGLEPWFRDEAIHGAPSGGGGVRVDRYLLDPGQQELGVKLRGGKPGAEIKGLVVARYAHSTIEPFAGAIEMWAKWSSAAVTLDAGALLDVAKRRYLRKFDTSAETAVEIPLTADEKPAGGRGFPATGCNVELTTVTVNGQTWWTLGFESFGAIRTVERSLLSAAAVLAQRRPPSLSGGHAASYPQWIATYATATT